MALYCKSAQVTRAEFQSEPKCRDQSMKASRKPGFRMGGKVQSSCIKERTRIFGLVVNPPLNRSTVHTVRWACHDPVLFRSPQKYFFSAHPRGKLRPSNRRTGSVFFVTREGRAVKFMSMHLKCPDHASWKVLSLIGRMEKPPPIFFQDDILSAAAWFPWQDISYRWCMVYGAICW